MGMEIKYFVVLFIWKYFFGFYIVSEVAHNGLGDGWCFIRVAFII